MSSNSLQKEMSVYFLAPSTCTLRRLGSLAGRIYQCHVFYSIGQSQQCLLQVARELNNFLQPSLRPSPSPMQRDLKGESHAVGKDALRAIVLKQEHPCKSNESTTRLH